MPGELHANSLFASFSLTCCHFICLSFFFIVHSPSSYTAPCSPVPPSPGPCGIETLTQQCKCREGWAARVRIQSGLAGRSKEMESRGPRRNFLTSPSQAAPWHGCVLGRSEHGPSPFRNPPSLTPPNNKGRTLWSKEQHSLKLIIVRSGSTSPRPVFLCSTHFSLNDALTKMSATWHWTDIARSHLGSSGSCLGLIVQSGSEVQLAPGGHLCGAGACTIEGELTKTAHSLCILAGSQDGAEGANHFKLWIPF